MSRNKTLPPGLCVMRLQGLEHRSTTEKTEVLTSIADDMQATLWCISRHLQSGNLTGKNTRPIDNMLRILHGPEHKKRRRLKRKIRRLQEQSDWVRQEQRKLLDATDQVVNMYKAKTETHRQRMRRLREEFESLKAERDFLRYRVTNDREDINSLNRHIGKDDHCDTLETNDTQMSQLEVDEKAELEKDITTSM